MMLIRSKWNLCNNYRVYGALLYCSEALLPSSQVDSLYHRLSKAENPRNSMTDVLDQWVAEGRDVKEFELQRLIKYLRNFRRHKHALQVSEWMSKERKRDLSPGDIAVRLDLISKVHGLEQAKRYFTAIPDTKKEFKVYSALLNCYAEHKSLDEAESIMQKIKHYGNMNSMIKQYGHMNSTMPYNIMLRLYAQMGIYEKLDHLMQEMKEKDICDSYTYMIRLNAYADTSDIKGMEKFLMQMEADPMVTVSCRTYTCAAKGYLKGGQVEKTMAMLKKSECLAKGYGKRVIYEYLLTMYATIGKKDEVYRVWNMYKSLGRFHNSGYICMLSSLVKLDDFDGAERILEEWESRHRCYDNRIPKLMITAYCKKGLLEKAEAYIRRVLESGKEVQGDAWDHLANGYRVHNDMEKAVQAMKKAFEGNQPVLKPNCFTLAACIDYAKEKVDLELALDILAIFREQDHLSEATYDRLLSYVHNETTNTNGLDLMKGDYQLEENDQVPEGEKLGELEIKESID